MILMLYVLSGVFQVPKMINKCAIYSHKFATYLSRQEAKGRSPPVINNIFMFVPSIYLDCVCAWSRERRLGDNEIDA